MVGLIFKKLRERIFFYCSDPLFKPNVERENKTFKGRLIAELRHENIIDDKKLIDI